MLSSVPDCIPLLGVEGVTLGAQRAARPASVGWGLLGPCSGAIIDNQGHRCFAILLGFFPFLKPEQTAGLGGLRGALWVEASLRQ